MTTVAELYNEDDHTVNHHGFSRNVKGEDKGKVGDQDHQNPISNDKSDLDIFWKKMYGLSYIV